MGTAMAEQRVVIEDAAAQEMQKLRDGFVRKVLARLTQIAAAKIADEEGRRLITAEDVRRAVREVLEDPLSSFDGASQTP